MKARGRIALDRFPEDLKYYTLTFPVARYKHLSLDGISDGSPATGLSIPCCAFYAGFGATCGDAVNC
jgi:hypothetical protein